MKAVNKRLGQAAHVQTASEAVVLHNAFVRHLEHAPSGIYSVLLPRDAVPSTLASVLGAQHDIGDGNDDFGDMEVSEGVSRIVSGQARSS